MVLLWCLLLWACASSAVTPAPSTTGAPPPATVPASSAPAAGTTVAAPAPAESRVPAASTSSAPPPATVPASSAPAAGTTVAVAAPAESSDRSEPVSVEAVFVKALPHDPRAFTQGLVLRDGVFYESTGLYGESTVRIVDPATGRVIRSRSLGREFFGEGLELVGDRLIQLTWKEETAFVWDAETLAPLGTFSYAGEGWGLCALEDRLVMSDGSSWLTFRDRTTFEPLGGVEVLRAGEPVERINELECVEDLVYANVWQTEEIMVIDPGTGRVVGQIDASTLVDHLVSTDGIDVLNGIAYDPEDRSFYLTGKLWPEIFQVRLSWN